MKKHETTLGKTKKVAAEGESLKVVSEFSAFVTRPASVADGGAPISASQSLLFPPEGNRVGR